MNKQRTERLTDEELEDLICELEAAGFYRRQLIGLVELQERRKADSAEPIGWTDAEELRSVERDGCGYLFKANPITPHADPLRVIKLYAVPPAPVVPPAIEPEYEVIKAILPTANPDEYACCIAADMWNACRAAMLQGKVDDEVGSWNNHKNTPTTKSVSETDKVPTVSFYRDGIEAAANWVDHQREIYDIKHGRQDPDTGAFEFGSDIERDYSDTFVVIAEGIRALHPNAGIPPAPVMPDSENGLMPCPFCGGKARQLTIEQDNDPHFGGDVITCTECGASSHVEFGFKENLKSAWNSRAAMLKGNVQ